ncbi:MAG: hypothetical protein QXN33_01715 [Candidatus Bathyarchaeia archaeon]
MNENHRRALKSGLLLVERCLHEIEDALRSHRSNSALYSIRRDIGPRTETRILIAIKSMLDEIGRIKKEFGLSVDEESLKSRVHAALAEIWVNLEELRPEGMGAYGRMAEEEERVLKYHILKLLRIWGDLHNILDEPNLLQQDRS